jgi:hypothetical protein
VVGRIRWIVLLLMRPPYLRWAAAALVVLAALAWDLSSRAVEPFPVAGIDIGRGEPIIDGDVQWIDVPRGSLPHPDLIDATAAVDIHAGDPITRSVTVVGSPVPSDWWSIPIDLPPGVAVGDRVRLTTLDGSTVDGVVSIAPSEDAFGLTTPGAVAVPDDAVSDVTVAVATDSVLVVVAP